jgi:hypothetical protein
MNQVKIMMAIARKKDNDKIQKDSEQKSIKKIFTAESRDFVYRQLIGIIKEFPEYDWRIYENINWRDTQKAYFILNKSIAVWQLNKDYFGWAEDLHNKWLSCLMRPEARAEDNYILLDLDDHSLCEDFKNFLKDNVVNVIESYKTPNGWHFIVNEFNSQLLTDTEFKGTIDIIRDGMKLIYFS